MTVFILALWIFALEAFSISPVEFTGALMLGFGLVVQGVEAMARFVETSNSAAPELHPIEIAETSRITAH